MSDPQAGEPPFKYHPLSPLHGSELAALHARIFTRAWPPDAFRAFLCESTVYGFAVARDTVSGFVLCRVAVDEAEVLTFGVVPEHRRRGVGGALLSLAMAEAVRRGARRMFLEVGEANAAARCLYDAAGFTCVGRRERYYRGGLDGADARAAALVLRCDLCDPKTHPGGGTVGISDDDPR